MRFTDFYLLFLGFTFHSVICRCKMLLIDCILLIFNIVLLGVLKTSNRIATNL